MTVEGLCSIGVVGWLSGYGGACGQACQPGFPHHCCHSRKQLTPAASCPLTSTPARACPLLHNKYTWTSGVDVVMLEIAKCTSLSGPSPTCNSNPGLAFVRQGFCYSASLDLTWFLFEQNFVWFFENNFFFFLSSLRGHFLRKEPYVITF